MPEITEQQAKILNLLGEALNPPTPEPETTAPAVPLDESEAAAAEGLTEMPSDIQALRERKLQIDREMGDLQKELDKIKGEVDTALTAAGCQGFTLHGKVKARRSPGTRSSVDAKQLKADLPEVYQKYLRITKYTSIRIT